MEKIIKEVEQELVSEIEKITKNRSVLEISDDEYFRMITLAREKNVLEVLSDILLNIENGTRHKEGSD